MITGQKLETIQYCVIDPIHPDPDLPLHWSNEFRTQIYVVNRGLTTAMI